jgi:dihydroorotate dehydrogenase
MLNLYRALLRLNLIPKANMRLTNPEALQTHLLGHKFNYPIGLAPGIDNTGKCISNLNDLGFEFIEIGPVSNEGEVRSGIPEIILSSNNLFFKKFENMIPVDNSNTYIQKQVLKILNNRKINSNDQAHKNLVISTNVKLSENSLRTVPYMSDSYFIKMVKTSLLLSDFTTINLSSYTNKAISQYKNKSKFDDFLYKLKNEVLFDEGIRAVVEYEYINKAKESSENLTTTLRLDYPMLIFKKTRSKILLRLDSNLNDDELSNFVNIVKNCGIIDGLVIGGMLNKYSTKEENSVKDSTISKESSHTFIAGEKSKESSLSLLKKCYQITKGEIPIISTGGVLSGIDVYERIKNGADFVLIYSPFLLNGPFCMEKILKEFEEKMIKETKNSIMEIRI